MIETLALPSHAGEDPTVEQSSLPARVRDVIEVLPKVVRTDALVVYPSDQIIFQYFEGATWRVDQPAENTRHRGGRYEIEEIIDGRGGTSFVYKAHDRITNQTYAIKELKPQYAKDPDKVALFRQEAAVHLSMRHEKIVPAYDYFEHEGRCFLVMNFVESPTIKRLIEDKQLTFDDSIDIITQFISASEYYLNKGIIVTDIKPANAFYDKKQLLMFDFGIIEKLHDTQTQSESSGTLSYMTPEQLKGLPVGVDAIPYYHGVLLYEMLTGVRMLERTTPDGDTDIIRTVSTIKERNYDPDRMIALQNVLRKLYETNGLEYTTITDETLWRRSKDEQFLKDNLHPFIYMLFKATSTHNELRYQDLEHFKKDFAEGVEALKKPWVVTIPAPAAPSTIVIY